MNLRTTDPFQALTGLQRALAAARPSRRAGIESTSSAAYPPINIFRKGDDFLLIAELAGVDKNALDVQVHNNQVRLAGTKSVTYEPDLSVHRRERRAGQFDRSFQLPFEVDSDKVKATFSDGMLTVTLPRAASDLPRTVPVA